MVLKNEMKRNTPAELSNGKYTLAYNQAEKGCIQPWHHNLHAWSATTLGASNACMIDASISITPQLKNQNRMHRD